MLTRLIGREEAKKENEFSLNSDSEDEEEDADWGEENEWDKDGVEDPQDVKDESSAYLDFLSEEVNGPLRHQRLPV